MRLWDFFFAARPLLHLPIWSIYLVSHYYLNPATDSISGTDILILICISLLAAGAYYINQANDVRSDAVNRKLGFIQEGLISREAMQTGWLVTGLVSLGLAFLFPWVILVIFLLLFGLGYLYSAPPFAWKNRPILGLLSNAFPFGFLIPIAANPNWVATGQWQEGSGLPAYFFLSVAAIYLQTTLPDRAGDAATGKRTVAVVYPGWAVKLMVLTALLGAAGLTLVGGPNFLAILALVTTLPVILSLKWPSHALDLFAAKFPILALTVMAGWFYPSYVVFVVVLILGTRLYYHRRFGVVYPRLF